jgi:hypothetical protein
MSNTTKTFRAKGQATLLMAVVIALLFALFGLVFEVGRLLIAREMLISASRRGAEAGLSFMSDYARNRAEFDRQVFNATINNQVWVPFYEESTGLPKFVRTKMYDYLIRNLTQTPNIFPESRVKEVGLEGITFPYKEPNWPTSAIGAKMRITVSVPLFLLQGFAPSVPVTVETISLITVEELLGITADGRSIPPGGLGNGSLGAGGSFSEFAGVARPIPESSAGWVEPFDRFLESNRRLITQYWGCPKEEIGAYAYALGRHAGMDFSIPEGTRLYAVAKGQIVAAGPYPNQKDPKVGNMSVILETEDKTRITYLHLLEIVVTVGQEVNAGELLGTSDGDPKRGAFAGFSSGAHLHFQVAQGGPDRGINFDFPYDIDPLPFLGLSGNPLTPPPGPRGACTF